MTRAIHVKCTSCQHVIEIASRVGDKMNCPVCNSSQTIQTAQLQVMKSPSVPFIDVVPSRMQRNKTTVGAAFISRFTIITTVSVLFIVGVYVFNWLGSPNESPSERENKQFAVQAISVLVFLIAIVFAIVPIIAGWFRVHKNLIPLIIATLPSAYLLLRWMYCTLEWTTKVSQNHGVAAVVSDRDFAFMYNVTIPPHISTTLPWLLCLIWSFWVKKDRS